MECAVIYEANDKPLMQQSEGGSRLGDSGKALWMIGCLLNSLGNSFVSQKVIIWFYQH
jgi:hypothetical protein